MTGKCDKTGKVLVVDDSRQIRARVIAMLDGIECMEVVGEATNGHEAVALAQELEADLVLLDIRMPGSGGLGALEMIKARAPSTKVVILTNYANSAYRSRCVALGADLFLDKSMEFDKLTEIVTELARGNRTTTSSFD